MPQVLNGTAWSVKLIALILFIGILAVTLLSVITSLYGWKISLELFSHFKVQYAVFCLVMVGLLILTRQKPLILISLLCLSVILADIVPWFIPQVKAGSGTANLRILSFNVHRENTNHSEVLSFIRQEKPDIAAFMEVDSSWIKRFESLHDILPYSLELPQRYDLGITLFSRIPLDDLAVNYFGTDTGDVPFKNASLLASISIDGKSISLLATHPATPIRSDVFYSRNKQLDQMWKYILKAKTPIIMMGDLNITMWSTYYKKFIRLTGLKNTRQGFGILPTWPLKTAFSPVPFWAAPLLSIPIDHCLISPGIGVKNIRTGPDVGSDHRALIVDLIL